VCIVELLHGPTDPPRGGGVARHGITLHDAQGSRQAFTSESRGAIPVRASPHSAAILDIQADQSAAKFGADARDSRP
jgi:hypothetical protein